MLGVPKNADADEIKKALPQARPRSYHPDKNPGDAEAEERFKEISEAYDVLSDDAKRKEYDEARTLFGSGGFRCPGASAAGRRRRRHRPRRPVRRHGGGGGGGGSATCSAASSTAAAVVAGDGAGAARGADVESEVTLGVRRGARRGHRPAAADQRRPVHGVPRHRCAHRHDPAACAPRCQGAGQVAPQRRAASPSPSRAASAAAAGSSSTTRARSATAPGAVASTRTVQARIPAGVKDGAADPAARARAAPGERGGPAGDLFVVVHVTPHPVFGRKGDNLTVTVPVTFAEAALGADVDGADPAGRHREAEACRRAPPTGARSASAARAPAARTARPGDLLVTVEVAVPQKLDARGAATRSRPTADATADHDPRADLLAAERPGGGS